MRSPLVGLMACVYRPGKARGTDVWSQKSGRAYVE
jgi:hypothetical protein